MSACRSCHAPIRWARTEHGRKIPLDVVEAPAATRHGLFALRDLASSEGPLAIAVSRAQVMPGDPLYVSHFATCPNANEHRRS